MSPCNELIQDDRIVGYVCTSHNELLRTGETEVRWCFGCRKRLSHTWELWGDPGPSYYEPEWICHCSGCHKDRTHFGDAA